MMSARQIITIVIIIHIKCDGKRVMINMKQYVPNYSYLCDQCTS